jgi:hypothetical protein
VTELTDEDQEKKEQEKTLLMTFRGPSSERKEATKVMSRVGFEFVAPAVEWRGVFPQYDDGVVPGVLLRAARERQGLTQVQLSEKTGIPQRHISEMESGKRGIGKKNALLLAEVLQIGYKVLLT